MFNAPQQKRAVFKRSRPDLLLLSFIPTSWEFVAALERAVIDGGSFVICVVHNSIISQQEESLTLSMELRE
jgi:hypothetical protein